MKEAQAFRRKAVSALSTQVGVYALCDLDGHPIYVGQSTDGIQARVRRHLTSARSDIIANRQVDVWEIAYVWAWPCDDKAQIAPLERAVFTWFDAQRRLMNGRDLSEGETAAVWPLRQVVQVIEEGERRARLEPSQRLMRQIQQYNLLVDYILNVKDAPHLKKSLEAHFQRLVRYHETFL